MVVNDTSCSIPELGLSLTLHNLVDCIIDSHAHCAKILVENVGSRSVSSIRLFFVKGSRARQTRLYLVRYPRQDWVVVFCPAVHVLGSGIGRSLESSGEICGEALMRDPVSAAGGGDSSRSSSLTHIGLGSLGARGFTGARGRGLVEVIEVLGSRALSLPLSRYVEQSSRACDVKVLCSCVVPEGPLKSVYYLFRFDLPNFREISQLIRVRSGDIGETLW